MVMDKRPYFSNVVDETNPRKDLWYSEVMYMNQAVVLVPMTEQWFEQACFLLGGLYQLDNSCLHLLSVMEENYQRLRRNAHLKMAGLYLSLFLSFFLYLYNPNNPDNPDNPVGLSPSDLPEGVNSQLEATLKLPHKSYLETDADPALGSPNSPNEPYDNPGIDINMYHNKS